MNIKNTLLIVFIGCLSLLSCAQKNSEKKKETQNTVELITPNDLNGKLAVDIQLIDIRTPEEYASGFIKGAKNINFYDSEFLSEMNKLDKSKPVYLYCRSGRRTGLAAKKLKENNFTKVYDLQGGILNWNKKSLEIIK